MSVGAGPQMSNFPYGFENGVTIRGVPIQLTNPGRVIWVYNGTALAPAGRGGSDGNAGTFLSPKATIAGALLQCVAGRGDVIMVKPGHTENLSAAAALTLSVAGVAIIGLGSGITRPKLTFNTSTAAQLVVSAAQVTLQNFYLDCTGVDAVVSALSVTGADFQFLGNDVLLASASAQATAFLTSTAAADRMVIDGNRFRGTSDAGTNAALVIVGGDAHQITNNSFVGAYGSAVGAISNITTPMTGALIAGNFIQNLTAGNTKAITAVAGSTGSISNNRVQILSGTAPFTSAAMSWVGGNYYANAVATAGTLI